MAYYNGFPATYQPMYQPIQPVQQTQQNGIIWVSGEAGAKAYMVAPNNTVQLWDSESQRIFLKSADASGMPSIKVLEYTIAESNKNSPNSASVLTDDKLSTFATKDEIKAVSEEIEALKSKIEGMTKRRARLMEEYGDE